MSQHHSSGNPTPPAKPATPPSTSSASAPEPYKPLAWAFPFTPADKSDGSAPMTYMKALAAAEDGFYPLGANGMWHGGIHFDQNTAKHLKQDEGIRAIADGEVVAYRLDSKYPEQDYQDGRHALYSTGFVLVRHKLQLPPPPPPKPDASKQAAGQPATAPASAAPATAGKASTASTPAAAPASSQPRPGETLTFFSLYMHLMDWNTYQSASAQAKVAHVDAAKLNMAPMPYWEGERFYRV